MSQFALLTTKRFLPLFITQFGGAFNDNVFKNALVILITYYAAEKLGLDVRLLVTFAAGIFILPFFLFSATAGQLADKYEKSKLIRIIKLIEVLLMITASLGFYFENTYLLIILLFLMGTQSTFFGPIKYSILPDHLQEKELIGGNALIQAATFIAILLGTIVGGIIILKQDGAIWISVIIIFTALAGLLASLRIPGVAASTPHLQINHNFISETWKIIQHTRQNKEVFLSIIGISWFWLLGFVFLAQIPVYGKHILGGDEEVVTMLLTMFSIGIGIGALTCNHLLKGKVKSDYAPWGLWGMSIFILLLWFFSPADTQVQEFVGIWETLNTYKVIFTCFLMIAMTSGIYIVPLYTIMQSRCEKTYRSRTVAANNILNAFFMVLGTIVTMLMLKAEMRIVDIFLGLASANIPVGMLVRRMVKNH